MLQRNGEYDDAEEPFHKSLEIQKRIHGNTAAHPSISSTLYYLGVVAAHEDDYDRALMWQQESLKWTKEYTAMI